MVLWVGSIGLGEALVPVIWSLRDAGVERETFWRLRSTLKEDERGAAMVIVEGWNDDKWAEEGLSEW